MKEMEAAVQESLRMKWTKGNARILVKAIVQDITEKLLPTVGSKSDEESVTSKGTNDVFVDEEGATMCRTLGKDITNYVWEMEARYMAGYTSEKEVWVMGPRGTAHRVWSRNVGWCGWRWHPEQVSHISGDTLPEGKGRWCRKCCMKKEALAPS